MVYLTKHRSTFIGSEETHQYKSSWQIPGERVLRLDPYAKTIGKTMDGLMMAGQRGEPWGILMASSGRLLAQT